MAAVDDEQISKR